ncbi:YitT family protein [Paenibacillus mendelii]|uniref:YitT family protein n=1 Tax=Paenibacillus mendelii TaxID=206163 RepID=A0ABV6JB79_9BACL|nr:YitT family protein [Paenibacillus mendelii]MCQ6558507.1 YitT family protein [Paenibacillus mendelii]
MKTTRNAFVITISAVLIAFGFNQLIIPHQMISGGISGITMIASYATGLNIAWLFFVLNVPILVWGWMVLGTRFIGLSVLSVVATSLALNLIPVNPVVTDPILGAVFGGVIVGLGSGLSLREGGSTGGFDIIASILSRKRDVSVGMLLFFLNASIIAALGLMNQNWDIALFSLLSIFTTAKVIDVVYIRHVKITAFIVSNDTEALLSALLTLHRGVTVIRTRGGYTQTERDMLMTVTTRYELAELRNRIAKADPRAFVNFVETVGIMGDFRRSDP